MKKLFVLLTIFLAPLLFFSCQKEEQDWKKTEIKPLVLETGQLKVMSFNIRTHTTEVNAFNHWSLRAPACVQMVWDQQPTLLGMQELSETQWTYMFGLLESNGYAGIATTDFRNSFMYKKDVLEVVSDGLFWLSDTPEVSSLCWDGYERTARWAVMRIIETGQLFFFVNTHSALTASARGSCITLIKKRIKMYNADNLPVVMVGDFNAPTGESSFDGIRQTMVNTRDIAPVTDNLDTYNGWDNPSNNPYVCDHIWISSTGIECSEYKTVTQPYYGHKLISDHFPVYSMLKF